MFQVFKSHKISHCKVEIKQKENHDNVIILQTTMSTFQMLLKAINTDKYFVQMSHFKILTAQKCNYKVCQLQFEVWTLLLTHYSQTTSKFHWHNNMCMSHQLAPKFWWYFQWFPERIEKENILYKSHIDEAENYGSKNGSNYAQIYWECR